MSNDRQKINYNFNDFLYSTSPSDHLVYNCILASAAARQAAAEAGQDGTKTVKANAYTGMSIQEARQILNVQDLEDFELLRKVMK